MTTYRYQAQAKTQNVVCDTCGCLVEDQTTHTAWHDKVDRPTMVAMTREANRAAGVRAGRDRR